MIFSRICDNSHRSHSIFSLIFRLPTAVMFTLEKPSYIYFMRVCDDVEEFFLRLTTEIMRNYEEKDESYRVTLKIESLPIFLHSARLSMPAKDEYSIHI